MSEGDTARRGPAKVRERVRLISIARNFPRAV